MRDDHVSRRALLAVLGGGAVPTLAGCGSSDDAPDGTSSPSTTSSPRTTTDRSGTARPTETTRAPETTEDADDGSDAGTAAPEAELLFETESDLSEPNPDGETLYASSDQLFALGVDGRDQWSVDLDGETTSVPGLTPDAVFISTRETLSAIDRTDGSTMWTFSSDRTLWQRGPTPTGAGAVYVRNGLTIAAINVRDGSKRWQFQPEYIDTEPAVADGTVYVPDASGTCYAVDAESGEERWRQPLPRSAEGSTTAPVTGPNTVFALSLTESYESTVTALAMADGTERWHTTLNARARQRPAVRDGVLYIGDSDSTLYAIDTTDGSTLWQARTDGHAHGSVTVRGETVYVGTNDGTVHAVDRSDGTERWRVTPGPAVTADPVAHDGRVFVSLGNRLYGLDVESAM